jgi:NDP-sugar pyrophosphorylase family protein
VTPKEYSTQLSQFITPYLDDEVHIELIQVHELFGSADAVRAVHDRIRGDFIIYNSDTLSQINLSELVQTHRLQSSDVTMLLAVAPFEESEKKGVAPVMKVWTGAGVSLYISLSLSHSSPILDPW